MRRRQLRSELTHYLDHLMDGTWLAALLEGYGLPAILEESATVLASGSPQEILDILCFTRDLGVNVNRWADAIQNDVQAALPVTILPLVRPLLRAPHIAVRHNAIYTLGKLCYPAEARTLRAAFPWFVERDPLQLPKLLVELGGLGDRTGVLVRARRLLRHESYLVRWSILDVADHLAPIIRTRREGARVLRYVLKTLEKDPVAVVRAEARFHLETLRVARAARHARWVSKAERRRRARAVEKTRPAITFSDFSLRYWNALAAMGRADYSPDDLRAFARELDLDAG